MILGIWYINGYCVQRNNIKAASYFKDAAFGGNAEGKYYYGFCFANGYGVKQDSIKALLWLDRSIEDNYYYSYYYKGLLYLNGKTVNKNPEQAFKYFLIGASHDEVNSQAMLGLCYLDGYGTDADTIAAIKMLEKAANNGSVLAQKNLGLCYIGAYGVSKDYQNALYWFEQAASQGDEEGYYYTVVTLNELNKDDLVFEYSKKGAELDFPECLNQLAYCYAIGQGTKQDFKKAISTIDRVISIEPSNPDYYDSKGEILWLKGDKKGAKLMWDKVQSLNPDYYKKQNTQLNQYIVSEGY